MQFIKSNELKAKKLGVGHVIEFGAGISRERRLIIKDAGEYKAVDVQTMEVANVENTLEDMENFYKEKFGYRHYQFVTMVAEV